MGKDDSLTYRQLANYVAKGIIRQFNNSEEQTNILMTLLSGRGDLVKSCQQTQHGYCRIASHLLKYLSDDSDAKILLTTQTKSCGKTALHFASSTGQPCQLRVLLVATGIDPNIFDKSGRAALHYAIERNNLEMVKMLMWYGADVSLCQRGHNDMSPIHLCQDLYNSRTPMLRNWFTSRVRALDKQILRHVQQIIRNQLYYHAEISSSHFMRLHLVQDKLNEKIRSFCLDIRSNISPFVRRSGNRPILFMLPMTFDPKDEHATAEGPHFGRVAFNDQFNINSFKICNTQDINSNTSSPLQHQLNDYYATFNLPRSIESGQYIVSFTMNSNNGFNARKSRSVILVFKAVLCSDDYKEKEKRD